MLSNNLSKFIKSLQLKKYRAEHSCFFVEGRVNVLEVVRSNFNVKMVLVTQEFFDEVKENALPNLQIELVKESDLEKNGTFKSNNFGLAVVEIPQNTDLNYNPGEWSLAYDQINDPGNFGTIIRTADWFGIKNIYCSLDSVDLYNPKVVNSTKGSFTRVKVHYVDLNEFLADKNFVTAEMDGKNLYDFKWEQGGVILMGNESHGVDKSLSKKATVKLTIPKIGDAESLNVAVASAIFCSDMVSKFTRE
jgi:RNA methyltransferase, TrmH family